MADVNFEQVGRDSKNLNHDDAQAARYARQMNGGKELSPSQSAAFSKGLIGPGNSFNNKEAAKSAGYGAASSLLDLSSHKGNYSGNEFVGVKEIGEAGMNAMKTGNLFGAIWEGVKNTASQVLEYNRQEMEVRNTINSSMGVTGKLGNEIRDVVISSTQNAYKFGFALNDIVSLYTNLNKETGRFAYTSRELNTETFKTAGAFDISLEQMGKNYSYFEKVGVGFSNTLKTLNSIGTTSLKLGLSANQTIADVTKHLDKVNQYGFKNGIQGLAEMSRISKIFRMEMETTFAVASKVMDPEGAVDMASRLQALGGAFGEFNDVFKLMYDSTNNVEGLQKSIIGMTKDLATYNEQQGRFEVTGANIRRAGEMAKITGIDIKELTKGAIAAQEKLLGMQQIAMNGLSINPKEKEFILNLATMENGEMKITIPESLRDTFTKMGAKLQDDGRVAVKDLNQKTYDLVKSYKDQFEQMSPEQIARGQYTELQNISHDIASVAAYFRSRIVEGGAGLLKGLGVKDAANLAAAGLDEMSSNLAKGIKSGEEISKTTESFLNKVSNFIKNGKWEDARSEYKLAEQQYDKERAAKFDKSMQDSNKVLGRFNSVENENDSDIESVLGGYRGNSNNNNSNETNDNRTSKVEVTFKTTGNQVLDQTINFATKAGLIPDTKKGSFTSTELFNNMA
jgi:hypothetical protein